MFHSEIDFSLLAIIISTITATGVIIAAFATIRVANSTKKQGFAQLMEGIETSFRELMERESSFISRATMADITTAQNFVTDYLNVLDRVAFYKNEKMINNKMFQFFTVFLNYGWGLLEWEEKVHGKKFDDQFIHLVKILKDENIEKYNWADMPYQLKYLAAYYEKERMKTVKDITKEIKKEEEKQGSED